MSRGVVPGEARRTTGSPRFLPRRAWRACAQTHRCRDRPAPAVGPDAQIGRDPNCCSGGGCGCSIDRRGQTFVSMPILLLLLALMLVVWLVLSVSGERRRRKLGIPSGKVVAADDADLGMPLLRSDRLGLVGRPDQLLRVSGALIPVEQKPLSPRAFPSHVLQLAAQCLLVLEVYGHRPPYGVLVLRGGLQERVPFTPALEARLHETMRQMRDLLERDTEPGPRWVAAKCGPCGFRRTCWGSLC